MSAILQAEAYAVELAACLAACIPEPRARKYAEHAAALADIYMGSTRLNYGNAHTPMPENAAEIVANVRAAACAATATDDADFDYRGGNKQIGGQARSWARVALVACMGATNAAKVLGDKRANVTTSVRRFREDHTRMADDAQALGASLRAVKP